jgi:hypothetical protein
MLTARRAVLPSARKKRSSNSRRNYWRFARPTISRSPSTRMSKDKSAFAGVWVAPQGFRQDLKIFLEKRNLVPRQHHMPRSKDSPVETKAYFRCHIFLRHRIYRIVDDSESWKVFLKNEQPIHIVTRR